MSKLLAALRQQQAARPAPKPAPAPPAKPTPSPLAARLAARTAPAPAARPTPATPPAQPARVPSARSQMALADKYRREQEALARKHAAELAKARGVAVKVQRELEAQRAQIAREKTRAALVSAARTGGAVDPDDVADLALARAQWALKGDKLVLATDASKDAAAWVTETLEAKPHLAARRMSGGSGPSPSPSRGVPGAMPPTDINEALHQRLNTLAAAPAPSGASPARK